MMAKERNRSYLKHTTLSNRLEAKLEHGMDDDTADRRSSETLKQRDSPWLRPSRKRSIWGCPCVLQRKKSFTF